MYLSRPALGVCFIFAETDSQKAASVKSAITAMQRFIRDMKFKVKTFIVPLDAKQNFTKLSRNVLKQLDVLTKDTINKN